MQFELNPIIMASSAYPLDAVYLVSDLIRDQLNVCQYIKLLFYTARSLLDNGFPELKYCF